METSEANNILNEVDKDGESWPQHCRQVARVSRCLADALNHCGADIDAELCERQGLLHDIGRSKTHGPLHGWTGFTMLRGLGHAAEARGCLAHWTKGRRQEELDVVQMWKPSFVARVYEVFEQRPWDIYDSVVSAADSSVRHTEIVSIEDRHQDLFNRYGDSVWMRRAAELAHIHATELGDILKSPVAELISPLYGTE